MPTTLPSTSRLTRYRLYRTALGARVTFSTAVDRQIPLVDGVTVLCATRDEVDAVLLAARQGGLAAKATHVRWPGVNHAIVIEDRRSESPASDVITIPPPNTCTLVSARCVLGTCDHRRRLAVAS